MRNQGKSNEILGHAKRDNLPLKILLLDVTDEESISEAMYIIVK
jgi:hypothetical protein